MAQTKGGLNARNSQPSPQQVIFEIALNYLVSRCLHVAAELGIADLLKDGPKSIEDLARVTGAHQPSLYRLLRTLAGHGVFAQESPGRFKLTPAAALLQTGTPDSLLNAVRMVGDMAGDGSWWNAVGNLRADVLTGKPGFDREHGMGFFEYLAEHSDASTWFDRGLANFAAPENATVVAAYDFANFQRVVDVGGGQGGLLAEILKAHPSLTGTLYDLPQVVRDPAFLKAFGLTDRCEIVGGNFFESLPRGGDAYLLKRILHDWGDQQCLDILRRCREAMSEKARILVLDAVLPAGDEPHPGKVLDILLMLLSEGRERTEQEFRELFERAGLELTKVIPTQSVLSIVEGRRRA
ncbi:MAG TPA: methyltransferase [Candidatus Binataceae bacterium]|nr:methyltransferase [Candidatus Binataceae bacterium]